MTMKLKHGKYAGCRIEEVPATYLEWLLAEAKSTIEGVENELERRRLVEEAGQDWAERLISAGYRTLAKQHHPDVGGDPAMMREINAAAAALRELLASASEEMSVNG
jgi:hypothetical protein